MKEIDVKKFNKLLKLLMGNLEGNGYHANLSEKEGGNHHSVVIKIGMNSEKLPIALTHGGRRKRRQVPEYVYKKELSEKLSKLVYGNLLHSQEYKRLIERYLRVI